MKEKKEAKILLAHGGGGQMSDELIRRLIVPKLLPWNELVYAMKSGFRVCHRDIFIAASFASAPLLEKKTFFGNDPGVILVSWSPRSMIGL